MPHHDVGDLEDQQWRIAGTYSVEGQIELIAGERLMRIGCLFGRHADETRPLPKRERRLEVRLGQAQLQEIAAEAAAGVSAPAAGASARAGEKVRASCSSSACPPGSRSQR